LSKWSHFLQKRFKQAPLEQKGIAIMTRLRIGLIAGMILIAGFISIGIFNPTSTVSTSFHVSRSAATTFRVLTAASNVGSFFVDASSIETQVEGDEKAGNQYRVTYPEDGQVTSVELVGFQDLKQFAFQSKSDSKSTLTTYSLVRDANGTQVNISLQHSQLGHVDHFAEMRRQLLAGDNVVLLANHQTEADPAVFALLLEAEFPELATDVIYVAGDRVVTDPLCKPFSMGRNLFCVHSKKHLDDIPELKAEKQATNRRTLKAMQTALNEGGKLLWIAPSGGRDRSVDAVSGENLPDSFDASAVELMRALVTKAKPQGHLYPFAMYSYRIMPPPRSVEKNIGERRLVFHAPVGISLGAELDVDAVLAGVEDKEQRQQKLADAAFNAVTAEYRNMLTAINEPGAASGLGFSQPWLNHALPALDQWL